jgi:hypothetical protein
MAAFDPAIVLLVHYVAVRARTRIVGQIGPATRVREGIRAEPEHGTQKNGDGDDRGV